jgi:hypothetical protein
MFGIYNEKGVIYQKKTPFPFIQSPLQETMMIYYFLAWLTVLAT